MNSSGRRRRLALTGALLGVGVSWLLAAPAGAQVAALTWDDPTLAEAVADADLVVLATAEAVGRRGVAYRVARVLKGPDRSGALLAVAGLHHPEMRERPDVEPGERAYLLLRGEPRGEGFALPTPTFGRFPLLTAEGGGAPYVVASLGGVETFVRLAVSPERFEALVVGLVAGPSPRRVAAAREALAAEGADPEAVYLALWDLALLAGDLERSVRDAAVELVAGALEAAAHDLGGEQARVRLAAARALGRLGGPRALTLLLRMARSDPDPGARSAATAEAPRALEDLALAAAGGGGDLAQARGRLGVSLAALARDAAPRPVTYGAADDPRRNVLESPFAACLSALVRLGAPEGVRLALGALETDDLDRIEAGLGYFAALGDPRHVGPIAARMRDPASPDAFVNGLFGRILEDLSGERLGDDKAAWLRWSRRAGGGPAGPPGSGGGGPR